MRESMGDLALKAQWGLVRWEGRTGTGSLFLVVMGGGAVGERGFWETYCVQGKGKVEESGRILGSKLPTMPSWESTRPVLGYVPSAEAGLSSRYLYRFCKCGRKYGELIELEMT